MIHVAALAASLASLGLIAAIYYCNIVSGPGSGLRNEALAMILLAVLTGLFPAAVVGSLVGLWSLAAGMGAGAGGRGVATLEFAALDIAAFAGVIASALLFRALVRATYRAPNAAARSGTKSRPA